MFERSKCRLEQDANKYNVVVVFFILHRVISAADDADDDDVDKRDDACMLCVNKVYMFDKCAC